VSVARSALPCSNSPAGGFVLAAALIAQDADGSLRHFDRLGYVVVTRAVISLIVMYFVQRPIAAQVGKRVV
jgi:hypothetical protein